MSHKLYSVFCHHSILMPMAIVRICDSVCLSVCMIKSKRLKLKSPNLAQWVIVNQDTSPTNIMSRGHEVHNVVTKQPFGTVSLLVIDEMAPHGCLATWRHKGHNELLLFTCMCMCICILDSSVKFFFLSFLSYCIFILYFIYVPCVRFYIINK